MSRSIIGSLAEASWRGKSYGDWHPGWTVTLASRHEPMARTRLGPEAGARPGDVDGPARSRAFVEAAEVGAVGVPGLNGFRSFVLLGVEKRQPDRVFARRG
jgi:hypothetical protein